MTTTDLIEQLREDISKELEQNVIAKLIPIIESRLYNNVFDIHQAAKYLKRSETTLRRTVDEKAIPFFRQRGQIFFRQSDIDRWIDEQVSKNYKPA